MFSGKKFTPFENKVWLATPTQHEEMIQYIKAAYDDNWMTTAGEKLNEMEK